MGRLFNENGDGSQPTSTGGRLGGSGFFSAEEEEKRRKEREAALKNVPETFQQEPEKPKGFFQKAADFLGIKKVTKEDKDKQLEQAKGMAQEMLPEKQKQVIEENKQAVERKKQQDTSYYEKLKTEIQAGTAVKPDRLILNVESARVENQKRYDDLMRELQEISPTDDPSNDVKLFGLDIYNPDKPKVAAFELGMLRAANLGNYQANLKDNPAYDRALQIERELTKIDEENMKFERFLNVGKQDQKFLQDVVVSAELPVAEAIDRAEEMAKGQYIQRASKDIEEVEKPEGFWANFKNQVSASTQLMTRNALSGLSEALSDTMTVEDGEVPLANRLSQYADDVSYKLQVDMAENPQWFYTGDDPDEKVAALVGKVLPSFGGVIAATAIGVASRGKINPTPLLQASFYAFAAADYGQAYREAVDAGATVDQAQKAATFTAVTSFALNKWADTILVKGSGFGLSDDAVDASASLFKDRVRNFALASGKTFMAQSLIQGSSGVGEQLGYNVAKLVYDENPDLLQGVAEAGITAGLFGGTFGLVSDPLSRKQLQRANANPEAAEIGALLREKGMVAGYDDLKVSTVIEPVTMYRGTVEDDSSRPTMQLGKSYTMNPLEPDRFANDAGAASGQKPVVQTVQIKPGSKIIELPDTYDARLLNPDDPRLEGVDAVVLVDSFIKNGEQEIVVLNDKAVEITETRPAVDVLNVRDNAGEEVDYKGVIKSSTAPVDPLDAPDAVLMAGGSKMSVKGAVEEATRQRDSYLKDVEDISSEIGGRYPKELEEFSVKSIGSLAEKLNRPDASGGKKGDKVQTDLLRFTIEIKDPKDLNKALASLKKRGYEVYEGDITNRFDDPNPGYKDISLKLVKGDGDAVVKELQLLQPNMLKAKMDIGHDIYDIQKRISLYKEANPENTELAKVEQQLIDYSNRLYAEAFFADNPSSALPASTSASKSALESGAFMDSPVDINSVKDFLKTFEDPMLASRNSSDVTTRPDESLSVDADMANPVSDDTGTIPQEQSFVKEEKPKTSRQVAQEPVPQKLYHATLEKFDKFDIGKAGSNTDKPNAKWGIFFSDDRARALEFVETARGEGDSRQANVIEASVDIKNPLDLTLEGIFNKEGQAPVIYKALTGEDLPPKEALAAIDEALDMGDISDFYKEFYSNIENKKVVQDAGYDGIVSQLGRNEDGTVIKEYVAFNTEQIKTGSEGGDSVSSTYNRVKDRLAEEFRDDVSYDQLNMEQDARVAVEFVASDPKKAKRIALGLENPPAGVTETAISIAAANAAGEAGDFATQARLESARSLRQTRRGQEIVAERGRFDENSPHTAIAQVIAARLQAVSKTLGSDFIKEMGGKSSKKAATKVIDQQKVEVKKVLTKSDMKINEAQKLIDALTC